MHESGKARPPSSALIRRWRSGREAWLVELAPYIKPPSPSLPKKGSGENSREPEPTSTYDHFLPAWLPSSLDDPASGLCLGASEGGSSF